MCEGKQQKLPKNTNKDLDSPQKNQYCPFDLNKIMDILAIFTTKNNTTEALVNANV